MRHLSPGLLILREVPTEVIHMNDDSNGNRVGSPLPTSLCEQFQVDLSPVRRSRTCSLGREGARSSTYWVPIHRMPEETWRCRGHELDLCLRRGESCSRWKVVKECLIFRGGCDVRGALRGDLKPEGSWWTAGRLEGVSRSRHRGSVSLNLGDWTMRTRIHRLFSKLKTV